MKNAILIFSILLFTLLVCIETESEQIHTYTVADGLIGPVVPVIFQDSRGNLWFGSDRGGVSRFDGIRFESYIGYLDTSENAPTSNVGPGHSSDRHDKSLKINGDTSGSSPTFAQKVRGG